MHQLKTAVCSTYATGAENGWLATLLHTELKLCCTACTHCAVRVKRAWCLMRAPSTTAAAPTQPVARARCAQ
jgi:hypothetical protein